MKYEKRPFSLSQRRAKGEKVRRGCLRLVCSVRYLLSVPRRNCEHDLVSIKSFATFDLHHDTSSMCQASACRSFLLFKLSTHFRQGRLYSMERKALAQPIASRRAPAHQISRQDVHGDSSDAMARIERDYGLGRVKESSRSSHRRPSTYDSVLKS